MFKKYLALGAILILSSCSYAFNGTIQEVTFVTPGANDAKCDVFANDFKYRVSPPQTINLTRSNEDLEIKCLAPGNRRKEMTVETVSAKRSLLNVFNGIVPGAAVDIASGAAFKYPAYIEIDFRQIPAKAEETPGHHNPDIIQPREHTLEEFGPSVARLNSDRTPEPVSKTREEVVEPSYNSATVAEEAVIEAAVVESIDLENAIIEPESEPDYSGSKSDPDPIESIPGS